MEREALKLAEIIEHFDSNDESLPLELLKEIAATLRTLAQPPLPAQEPVAWITPDGKGFRIRFSPPTNDVPLGWDALYTTQPQREWVELTDEDIHNTVGYDETRETYQFALALIAKIKEKNS